MADDTQKAMSDKYNTEEFAKFLKDEGKGSADAIWNNGAGEEELKGLFDAFKKKQNEATNEQGGNAEGHGQQNTLNVSQQVNQ